MENSPGFQHSNIPNNNNKSVYFFQDMTFVIARRNNEAISHGLSATSDQLSASGMVPDYHNAVCRFVHKTGITLANICRKGR